MSLFAYLNGTDQATAVRLGEFGITSRADGSVGIGSIIFDDDAAALTVRGWMSVIVKETACVSAPVLFSGYIFDRTYSRTDGSVTYKTGVSRFVNCNLLDQNAVNHIRLITGSDGKRPAETHIQRIDWLLGSAYLSGLVADFGLVERTTPRPFEEADYRGQYADDVLADLAGPIFRTFFNYIAQPAGAYGLFFDTPNSVVSTSTITISNRLVDTSATCFFPFTDAELTRDPSEVYAKIRYTYANGTILGTQPTTNTTFFTDNSLSFRGLQVDNTRVGLESTARSMGDQILTRDSTEQDTVSVTILMPPSQVGLVDAGQRIGVRFTHLPGYDTALTYTRVTARTITQISDEWYQVSLELNTGGLSSAGGGGAPGPGTFPNPPGTSAPSLTSCVTTSGSGVSASSTATYLSPDEQYRGSILGAVSIAIESFAVTGYTAGSNYCILELAYSWDGGAIQWIALRAELTGTPGSFTGNICWNAGVLSRCQGESDGTPYPSEAISILDPLPAAGVYSTLRLWGIRATQNDNVGPATFCVTLGPVTDQATGLVVPNEVVASPATAPQPGQWIGINPPEIVVMTGSAGVTKWPFATGSLKVYVDKTDQTASIASSNGATGAFNLNFSPTSTETVTVTYQGR